MPPPPPPHGGGAGNPKRPLEGAGGGGDMDAGWELADNLIHWVVISARAFIIHPQMMKSLLHRLVTPGC